MADLTFALAAAKAVSMAFLGNSNAGSEQSPDGALPAPNHGNVPYGPHERNVLDLWKAGSEQPTPLIVHFHGGGFCSGDKGLVAPPLVEAALAKSISVASCNYRLSDQAPFPAPMLDGARAVQFLRSKADEWNLDGSKFAACGGSAGAGISLWIAFHDDLADPDSDDPVERESTRLACAGSINGQCSYDPRFIKQHIGGSGDLHPVLYSFYGLTEGQLDTPEAYKLYEQAAPITYLTADDPPIFTFYPHSATPVPLPADADAGAVIHHPQFGVVLKQRMEELGIECVLRLPEDYDCRPEQAPRYGLLEMVETFARWFAAP
jgi:acetyl esterase